MSDTPRHPTPPERQHRQSRPSVRNQVLMVVGILLLAGGAFYTALIVATQVDHVFFPDSQITLGGPLGNIPFIDSEGASGQDEFGGQSITVLVMGVDRRPGDGEAPGRADTMFVTRIDTTTSPATARGLAMPRDLWVEIHLDDDGSVWGYDRINTALPHGGISAAKATVENLLGIRIDHYIIVDFEGFRDVVDLLGGIEVEVLEPGVDDPYYSETELPGDYYPCVFEPGRYHMNGSDALCYARVRRGSNDLDRIQRQQVVIYAMIERAGELGLMTSPQQLVTLWSNYKSTVITDISDLQVPGFARLAGRVDQGSMSFQTLAAVASEWTTPQGAQVLVPSPEGVAQIVEAFLSDGRLHDEAAQIEVQNGTANDGWAARAVDIFAGHGIPSSSLTAVDAMAPSLQTQIIVYNGKQYTAERIAIWLGLPRESIRSATQADLELRSTEADIVVILGTDADLDVAATRGGG